MNGEKEKSSSDPQHSVWENMSDWASSHPFVSVAEKNTDNDLTEDDEEFLDRMYNTITGAESLSEMRHKHIAWLKGEYEPDSDEYDSFSDDEGFYSCEEYLTYRKSEIDSVAEKRADIYALSDEEMKRNMTPFVELVRSDIGSLMDIGSKMGIGSISEENVSEIVDYFCTKFGVDERPKTELIKEGGSSGNYSNYYNRIRVKIDKTSSIAELISTVAHEVWHAHHHRSGSELYKYNFENYYQSSMDYDAYRGQLVEKEAFFLGDSIGQLYRRADLEAHPEKIPSMLRLYDEWLDDNYKPSETEDGLDYEYLCIANDGFRKYRKNGTRDKGMFFKLFRRGGK